ncbi:MAG: hypothetical protein AAGF23_21155 [Acidobacteriota bacterium]
MAPPSESAPDGPRATPELYHSSAGVDALVLDPLADLLDGDPPPVVELEASASGRMPEPYRRLLVHHRDMTSTLEHFHGEPSVLEVLAHREDARRLLRKVLLRGRDSGHIQEFGAIRIELDRFASEPRRAILEGRTPLGAILARHSVSYRSRPQRFFAIRCEGELCRRLGHADDGFLFGRRNLLVGDEGTLAEVVEILPPTR